MHKLLTLDDLVKFCEQNNFAKFNAKDSGYQICVQIPARFDKDDAEDDQLFFGNVLVMHTGVNRNKSSLTEDAAKKAIKNLAYKPVLANFCEIDGVKDFTSHDFDIDENGDYIYYEKQVGCFTADKAYMEQDADIEDRMNIFAKIAIPREYTDAAEIIERKNGTKCSVELGVNELSYSIKDKVLMLEDVDVMGLTLLGKNPETGDDVQEGMEGAHVQIEDFSAANNSLTFNAQMINSIADAVTKRLSNKADDSALYLKEGGKTPLKFEELLKQYNKTAEDIEFDYANMSDEELETAFKTAFDDPELASEPTDAEAAAAVTALIEALPSTITTDSESDITAAREAYDALSAEAKALVTAETLAVLTGAESSLGEAKAAAANQTAADAVTALIEALSNDITMDDVDAVTAAGQAYDSLTPAQKALISSDDVTALEEARNVIANGLSADEGAKNKKKKQNNELTYTVVIDDVEKTFAVSLVDKLNALSQLVNNTYSESDNTYYDVDAYDDEKYVIMHDYWNNKHFRQSYSVKKDVYSLRGDRVEVFAQYLTADQIAKLDSMKSDYASITEKLAKYEAEPAKMEILNSEDYANIADTAEFVELKKEENHFDMSVEELKAECDKQLLAYAKGNKIEFAENKQKKSVGMKQFGQKKSGKTGRYGNLFKK